MPETHTYLRPGFFLSKIMNPLMIMFKVVPSVTIKGRKSGKLITTPITPITVKEKLYLVAPRGETQWARNLRVIQEGTLTMKGQTTSFKATEITGTLRDEVVKAYQTQVKVTAPQFKELPNPKDHPTFQITLI